MIMGGQNQAPDVAHTVKNFRGEKLSTYLAHIFIQGSREEVTLSEAINL